MVITLGPITGLSAGWLGAAAAAGALPVAIHLMRRRARRVVFPPTVLVAHAEAPAAKGRRLRELLVLALRIGAVVAMALAFDQPVVNVGAPEASAGEQLVGRDVVIVLDRSASMGRDEGDGALFVRAQREVAKLLEALDPRIDRAGVVLLGSRAAYALPALTRNFSALVKRIHEVEVSDERGDAAAALRAAESLLADAASGEIVILSDHQASQWGDVDFSTSAHAVRAPRLVGADTPANCAIGGVAVPEERLRVGAPVEIGVKVAKFNSAAPRAVATLEYDGESWRREVAFDGDEAVARFDVTPGAPGRHALRATVAGSDALAADNFAEYAITVAAPARIGFLHAGQAGAMFVRGAIEAASGAPPTELMARDLAAGGAADVDGLVIYGAPASDGDAHEALSTLLQRSAGVVWIIDSADAAQQAASLDWLPLRVRVANRGADPARPDAADVARFLRVSGDDARGAVERLCETFLLPPLTFRVEAGAHERVRTRNNGDFAALHASNGVRFAMLAAPAIETSAIASHPLLPMMIQELLHRIIGDRSAMQVVHQVPPAESDLVAGEFPFGGAAGSIADTKRGGAAIELWPYLMLFAFLCAGSALAVTLATPRHAQEAQA